MLRYKTELAWFSRLVHHPARKQNGSILTTPEPAWDPNATVCPSLFMCIKLVSNIDLLVSLLVS